MNKFEYSVKIQSQFTSSDWDVIFDKLKSHYEMALGGRLYGIKGRIGFARETKDTTVYDEIYLDFGIIDRIIAKAFEYDMDKYHIFIKCIKMLNEINEEHIRLTNSQPGSQKLIEIDKIDVKFENQ